MTVIAAAFGEVLRPTGRTFAFGRPNSRRSARTTPTSGPIIWLEPVEEEARHVRLSQRIVAGDHPDGFCFEKPVATNGRFFTVRASMGVSLFPRDAQDVYALMANAHAAIYRVKKTTGEGRKSVKGVRLCVIQPHETRHDLHF